MANPADVRSSLVRTTLTAANGYRMTLAAMPPARHVVRASNGMRNSIEAAGENVLPIRPRTGARPARPPNTGLA